MQLVSRKFAETYVYERLRQRGFARGGRTFHRAIDKNRRETITILFGVDKFDIIVGIYYVDIEKYCDYICLTNPKKRGVDKFHPTLYCSAIDSKISNLIVDVRTFSTLCLENLNKTLAYTDITGANLISKISNLEDARDFLINRSDGHSGLLLRLAIIEGILGNVKNFYRVISSFAISHPEISARAATWLTSKMSTIDPD